MGIDIYKARRTGSVSRKRLTLQTLALAALLASNFLAAGVIVNKAFEIMTRYTASVANHSSLPLQAVRIHGGGTDATLGDIPPGEQKHASLWFKTEGPLVLTATHGSRQIDEIVDEYVIAGNSAAITIDAAGHVNVQSASD